MANSIVTEKASMAGANVPQAGGQMAKAGKKMPEKHVQKFQLPVRLYKTYEHDSAQGAEMKESLRQEVRGIFARNSGDDAWEWPVISSEVERYFFSTKSLGGQVVLEFESGKVPSVSFQGVPKNIEDEVKAKLHIA